MRRIAQIIGWVAIASAIARLTTTLTDRNSELKRLRKQLKKDWKVVAKEVHKSWNWLTDEELDRVGGEWDRLVTKVRKRTGSSAEAIEGELKELLEAAAARR